MLRIVFKTLDELACSLQTETSPGEYLARKGVFNGMDVFNSIEYDSVNNLFSTLNSGQLGSLVKRAKANDPGYNLPDFYSYYCLDYGEEIDTRKTVQSLNENICIEWAYAEKYSALSPHAGSVKKPLACYQGYLYDAPLGIGASSAWRKNGGRGDSSVKFVDIEQGWMFDHESLDLQRIPNTGINHEAYRDHGAAVMGIIMMRDGGSGGIGITSLVKGSVMSLYRPNGILNTADAILSALLYLDAGDILLLETQVRDPDDGFRLWPAEIREAVFDMIRLATALGITVIEPCGNGNLHSSSGNNLDEYRNSKGQKIFDRSDVGFRDSGAIMVAAATSDVPHQRMHYSNYGNRVDCYGWGENILTAGLHPHSSGIATNTYNHQFGGTSGAAAIIGGVAISLQSMIEANHQCRLTPHQLRQILGSSLNGTDSVGGTKSDQIGVMPDLEKITRNFVDKFNSQETVIPPNSYNIEMPYVHSQAV